MIYSADMGVGKVAGIRLDQDTGELKVAFVVDNATTTFQPVIGPKDRRVLLLTNAKKNDVNQPMKLAMFTGNTASSSRGATRPPAGSSPSRTSSSR